MQTQIELSKIQYNDELKLEEDKLDLEIESKTKLILIEIEQFKNTVSALSPETIV